MGLQDIREPGQFAAKLKNGPVEEGETLRVVGEVRLSLVAVDAVAAEKAFVVDKIDGNLGIGQGGLKNGRPVLLPA